MYTTCSGLRVIQQWSLQTGHYSKSQPQRDRESSLQGTEKRHPANLKHQDDVLLRLLFGGGPAEVVKVDAEPGVDVAVDLEVLVADLLGSQPLGQRLGLRRRPVLVGAADVQHVVIPQAAKPTEGTVTNRNGRR